MSTSTRLFQKDLTAPQKDAAASPQPRSYTDLTLEKARENARLIEDRADQEIQGILYNIERMKMEFDKESRLIQERIEKKRSILSKLESLELSAAAQPRPSDLSAVRTEDLYQNLANQTRQLSILTSILDELQAIAGVPAEKVY